MTKHYTLSPFALHKGLHFLYTDWYIMLPNSNLSSSSNWNHSWMFLSQFLYTRMNWCKGFFCSPDLKKDFTTIATNFVWLCLTFVWPSPYLPVSVSARSLSGREAVALRSASNSDGSHILTFWDRAQFVTKFISTAESFCNFLSES